MKSDREIIGYISNFIKNVIGVTLQYSVSIKTKFFTKQKTYTYWEVKRKFREDDRPPTPEPIMETRRAPKRLIKCSCGMNVNPSQYNPSVCPMCISNTIERLHRNMSDKVKDNHPS